MLTSMSTSRSNYTDMSIWKKHADHSTSMYALHNRPGTGSTQGAFASVSFNHTLVPCTFGFSTLPTSTDQRHRYRQSKVGISLASTISQAWQLFERSNSRITLMGQQFHVLFYATRVVMYFLWMHLATQVHRHNHLLPVPNMCAKALSLSRLSDACICKRHYCIQKVSQYLLNSSQLAKMKKSIPDMSLP